MKEVTTMNDVELYAHVETVLAEVQRRLQHSARKLDQFENLRALDACDELQAKSGPEATAMTVRKVKLLRGWTAARLAQELYLEAKHQGIGPPPRREVRYLKPMMEWLRTEMTEWEIQQLLKAL